MSIWPSWKDQKLFTVLVALLLVFGICFLSKKTESLMHPTPTEHQISVEGYGKVTGTPDLATISFGVETRGTDVATAQTQNTTTMNALNSQVKALGVADEDMQTSNYSVYEDKVWDSTTNQEKSNGWIISQNVTVKVRDTSKIGTVITTVGQNGATNISGPTFTIDDSSNLKAEARQKAIADAEKQATVIAQSLGLHLRRVVGYSEWSDDTSPMPYAGFSSRSVAALDASTVGIETGSNDVALHVSVTFSLDR